MSANHAARLYPPKDGRPGSVLWPAIALLMRRGKQGATSLEIDQAVNPPLEHRNVLVGVGNMMADIRKRAPVDVGCRIPPVKYEGRNQRGRRICRYFAEPIAEWTPSSPEAADQEPRQQPAPQPAVTDGKGQGYIPGLD